MGLLDWLFSRSPPVEVIDKIWLTDQARRFAILGDLLHFMHAQPVLLLVHFSRDLSELEEELTQRSIPFDRLPNRIDARDFQRQLDQGQEPRVFVGLAKALEPGSMESEVIDGREPVAIMILGRHFLRQYDDRVLEFAKKLGRRCETTFHLSLEDPLLKQFSGEWIQQVLRKLGMKESEAIESKLVQRRLILAQQKIAGQVGEVRGEANSAEEWLQKYLPK
jgi:preprotein translocase subunit SecA